MKTAQKINQIQNRKRLFHHKNLQIIFGVSLISFLGISSITPAFPKLVQELNIPPQNVGLLISVFTFPSIFFSPIIGVLADRLGRKKILIPSLILFSIAGTTCAFIHDFNLLLVMRFLQGIGNTSLLALSITLISDLYSGQERITALGYNASIISIGTAFYPLIGGTLAIIGWNYPFMLPLLAIPVSFLVLFLFREPKIRNKGNLKNYLGSVVKTMKNRQFIGIFASTTATFILLSGTYITYIPIFIQDRFHTSTIAIGLIISGMFITVTLTASQFGQLTKVISGTRLIQSSFLLYALALITIPFIYTFWMLLVSTIIFGVALGIGLPSIQNFLVELAPQKYRATMMSLNGTFLGLGQTLGPFLLGIFFSLWGIDGVFFVGSIFAICIFLFLNKYLYIK